MTFHFLLLLLCTSLSLQRGKRGPPSAETSTEAATTVDTSNFSDDDDEYVTLVKGYIDAGTCDSTSANTNCGDDATSYYKEFEYNDKRVIISSGVPDHTAETDAIVTNPNTRCETWTYVSLPIDPTKDDTADTVTGLGVIALAVTGGTFFNYLSNPDGSVALYNEGQSLDSCMGHSNEASQYHYHANILCSDAGSATGASDADECVLVGYMRDGVPVYGYCKDSYGVQYTSCYTVVSGSNTATITTAGGDFTAADNISDYEYDQDAFDAGTCNLDKGSGAIHPTTGQYSYFLTADYPWTPIYYFGLSGSSNLCSAA